MEVQIFLFKVRLVNKSAFGEPIPNHIVFIGRLVRAVRTDHEGNKFDELLISYLPKHDFAELEDVQ